MYAKMKYHAWSAEENAAYICIVYNKMVYINIYK